MDVDPLQGAGDAWAKAGGSSALEDESTKALFQSVNPKQRESKAWHRYEKYKAATTVGEAIGLGAERTDLNNDFKKKIMTITTKKRKREAATGTPDRESAERAARPSFAGAVAEVPQMPPIEHRAFTLDDIKSLMETTFRNEMTSFTSQIRETFQEIRGSVAEVREELRQERVTREREQQAISERCARIEEQLANRGRSHEGSADDKLTLVVGGFGTVPKEVALDTVSKALDDVAGFVEAFATSDVPSVVFARFDTDDALTTFLKQQNECEGFGRQGLRAGRSKPPEERRRQRALNKIKRAVCENTKAESKAVRLNRRTMKAFRIEGHVAVEIALVNHDAKVIWAQDVSPAVRARTEELLNE